MNLAATLPPAGGPDHRIRIDRVPPGAPFKCTVAATRAATTWTHFPDGRTLPCSDDEHCTYCSAGLNRKFEAYLAVQDDRTCERLVLALPEGAWRQIAALVGSAADGGLWGHHFEFLRVGGKRGRLEVFDGGPLREGEKKPKPVNTPLVLQRAWHGADGRPVRRGTSV